MKKIILSCSIIISVITVAAQKQEISLNHTALFVEDLKKSAAFYKEIIGLDSLPEPFKDGLHAWFKTGENLSLHIIQGPKERIIQYRNTHTCFSVSDIELFVDHLVKKGITYEDLKGKSNSVTTRTDGIKQVYFKDPDGYWIEINNDK